MSYTTTNFTSSEGYTITIRLYSGLSKTDPLVQQVEAGFNALPIWQQSALVTAGAEYGVANSAADTGLPLSITARSGTISNYGGFTLPGSNVMFVMGSYNDLSNTTLLYPQGVPIENSDPTRTAEHEPGHIINNLLGSLENEPDFSDWSTFRIAAFQALNAAGGSVGEFAKYFKGGSVDYDELTANILEAYVREANGTDDRIDDDLLAIARTQVDVGGGTYTSVSTLLNAGIADIG